MIQTFIVDSFTDKPFQGNPAGVCLLEEPITEEIMQSVANELNLSETVFLLPIGNDRYELRYFTPSVEVEFCGHATLAASKIIFDKFNNEVCEFVTYKGLQLNAKLENEAIKMSFPLYETIEYVPNKELLDALGLEEVMSTRFSKDLEMLVIEVKDKQTLLNVDPNFQKAIESSDSIKEVVITTKSEDSDYDFYSRCFCPWIGINEDPVTGAAHTVLAKYWGDILNKKTMSAFQLSKRGGYLNLTIVSNDVLEVRSNAKIIFKGELNI